MGVAKPPPTHPVIAVIGATGTGKSQLAVDLAKRFNGEVINADAMQMYKGLPVITNKIRPDEQKDIRHHLIDFIDVSLPAWRVDKFVPHATECIERIHREGKLPIIVGGTHYYIQKLLFSEGLSSQTNVESSLENDSDGSLQSSAADNSTAAWPMLDQPTEALYQKLQEVDPIMANRWHPKDRRKIQRSLQLWLQTGRKASDIYAEQAKGTRNNVLQWPTLFFWTHASPSVLNTRLDARVEKMIQNGLIDEVSQLHSVQQKIIESGYKVDETSGIWVSIGYKEFKAFQEARLADDAIEMVSKLRQQAVERTKISTRQYAKSQLKWVRIKLMNALKGCDSLSRLFLVDTSAPERWDSELLPKSINIAAAFLDGEKLPDPIEQSELARELLSPKQDYDLSHRPDLWQVRHCAQCGISAATPQSWEAHKKSRQHRRLAQKASSGSALISQNSIEGPD